MLIADAVQARLKVTVNRLAAAGREGGSDGPATEFEQAFKLVFNKSAARLRQPATAPHLAFEVLFTGEHVWGEAGPYRAFFGDVCSEVITGKLSAESVSASGSANSEQSPTGSPSKAAADSPALPAPSSTSTPVPPAATPGQVSSAIVPLFVPVPNAETSVGENRDKFMLRAGAQSQAHIQHLEVRVPAPGVVPCLSLSPVLSLLLQFLGRLFGAALRTRVLLPLPLPSLFWKGLMGAPCNTLDLEAVYKSLVDGVIAPLRSCATPDEFAAKLQAANLKWSVVSDFSVVCPCSRS